MVDAGHWYWLPTSGPWLNGIPLMNSLGWFCVGVLMITILDWLVAESPRVPNADLLIWVLLGWVWFSEIFGHLVFFGRPCVALIGGLATTLVGVIVFRTGLRRRNNVDQVSNACRLNNVGPVNNDDRVNIVGNGEQADRVR